MTDTQSRRRALLSLLDQFPLERDLYLYEGRREVSPREEFADKIEALFMPEGNASITTPEGQRDYYRDLVAEVSDENKRLARDLAEYEAYDALPSMFEKVMTISPRYVKRFKGTPSAEGVFLAFDREYKEFLEACDELLYDRASFKLPTLDELRNPPSEEFQNYYQRNVAHEAADVLVTIGGILDYLGIEWAAFLEACGQTLKKLETRKESDYAWDGKTVQHRSKIEGAS